ncbi:MAG: hypothetical protein ILP02_02890 [Clostridia bacterium]|nr:hypothetical protein [Clostridia bacterium]
MNRSSEEIIDVISDTLKSFSYLTDANTVVGTPVTIDGATTVIPVSKMTVACLTGGGQYGEVKLFTKNKNYPLSTGSGGVVSVKPSGFIVSENGKIRFLSCPEDYLEKATEKVFDCIEKLYEKI